METGEEEEGILWVSALDTSLVLSSVSVSGLGLGFGGCLAGPRNQEIEGATMMPVVTVSRCLSNR